jgi:transcriptional regulator with AAA-type ATPase domain
MTQDSDRDNAEMPMAAGGTLTEHQVAQTRANTGPNLVLALRGDAPLSGGQSLDMAGVKTLHIGRGGALALMPGAGPGNARLELPDPTTSGQHARLRFEEHAVWLEDLGSRNGTRLGNKHLEKPTRLQPGDWFSVGRSVFVYGTGNPGGASEPLVFGPSGLLATFVSQVADLYAATGKLAPSRVPMLLVGETGTGKEVLAREIHALSRPQGPFVAVNCAALPENLVESELFGYRKGAFSDAREDRPGLVRTANGGTLLLDEVTELPVQTQAKLLRFLQEGEVLAIGTTQPVKVDVRVVAATQPGLQEAVRAGRFRADLLARLAGFTLNLQPLRERIADLGLLTEMILRRHSGDDAHRFKFSADACNALFERRWPLNVRELEQTLQAAVVLARDGGQIEVAHLGQAPLPSSEIPTAPCELEGPELAEQVLDALRRHEGNVSAVAREMGKARMQIHRWMERFGFDPERFRLPPR